MQFAFMTDKGIVRSSNEDSCEAGAFNNDYAWGIVCDGMGGALAGEVASKMALEFISERIQNGYHRDMTSLSAQYLLRSAVIAAGIIVHDDSCKEREHYGMGTTVVAAIVLKDCIVCAYVGDSRAYIADKNGIIRITHDHSLVQERIDAGLITEEEARYAPDRNIITRVLGVEESVDVDIVTVPFTRKDKLLICSDGLTNMISEQRIWQMLKDSNVDDLPSELIQSANQAGGRDNISVVVIEK